MSTPDLTLTVERVLRADAVDAVHAMYEAAFTPMLTRAAARHMLTREEFTEEMADERIEKYVVWGDDAAPLGLGTLATDLTAVPWISPDFYAHRYADHADRKALFYLGFTLVDPAHERRGIHAMIMDAVYRRVADARAMCGVDLSTHSQKERIGRVLTALGQTPGVIVEEVDTQTYHAVDYSADPPAVQMRDTQGFYSVVFGGAADHER